MKTKVEPTVEGWEDKVKHLVQVLWEEGESGEAFQRSSVEEFFDDWNNTFIDFIRNTIAHSVQEAKAEERSRIWKEGWKLIEWHKNPKNQFAGILHANATINAIQDLLEKVRPSGNTPENSTLNTKTSLKQEEGK